MKTIKRKADWSYAYICFAFAIADAYFATIEFLRLGINGTTFIAMLCGSIVALLGILELSK